MLEHTNFLPIQESKYGRNEDGKVIIYNEYAGLCIDDMPVNSDDDETNVELQE